jgi:hypothetical protein
MITEMFKTKKEIKDFLSSFGYGGDEYKIHRDLSVSFDIGDLCLSGEDIKIIPFKIRILEGLYISETGIESFEDLNLPEGLKTLEAYDTPLKSTKGLPSTVENLDISYTLVEYLEDLPKGLKKLYVSNTPVKSLEGIPGNLEILNSAIREISKGTSEIIFRKIDIRFNKMELSINLGINSKEIDLEIVGRFRNIKSV